MMNIRDIMELSSIFDRVRKVTVWKSGREGEILLYVKIPEIGSPTKLYFHICDFQ